jgi:hypothetical protein
MIRDVGYKSEENAGKDEWKHTVAYHTDALKERSIGSQGRHNLGAESTKNQLFSQENWTYKEPPSR